MPAESSISCDDLFRTRSAADITVPLRVLTKAGRPLLLLPLQKSLAAQALSLYPAQTVLARFARGLLQSLLRIGLPVPWSATEIKFARNDAFPRFLAESAGMPSPSFPTFAILCGNARTTGRRFILMLFTGRDAPRIVVKAGVGESARQLIRHEAEFLQSSPRGISGLPSVRKSFTSEEISAFATDFVDGDSPRGEDRALIGRLLTAWLDRAVRVSLSETPSWQALEKVRSDQPLVRTISEKLADVSFCPALFHGDFAPWNIKVSPADGSWKVLDWERAERVGLPAWDWYHYFIQSGILVERLSAVDLARKLEGLFNAAPFLAYAETAGIAGSERALAVAYLLYCQEIIRPTEGASKVSELLSVATDRWLS